MITTSQTLLIFAASLIIVGVLTPIMRRIAIKIDFVDHPNAAHKSHKVATPYLGGISIIIGILVVVYAAILTQENIQGNLWTATSLFGPALMLGFVGLMDDRKALNPLPRFIAQNIAGIFTASILLITDTVGNPSGNSVLDAAITVIWIVGITNSINFFDNLDGGAAGAVAVTATGLFVMTQANGQYLIAATSIAIVGAMLGFLTWNKSPARIYMGDAGSLFLGTVLATLTVRLDPVASSKTISFAIPLFLLAVPVLDTTVAVISRIRRRISIFQGGHDHLSHRLLRRGFTKRECVYALWSLAVIFAGISLAMTTISINPIYILYSGGFLWVILFGVFLSMADD